MVQGDTLPLLVATLTHSDGITPWDLTLASSVKFTMKDATTGTVLVNNAACTIASDKTTGQVTYTWQIGDTATATTCNCEFKVTFIGGAILTFPAIQNDLKVVIRPV